MEPERIDLSPLDLRTDQLAYERLVRRIVDAAAPELARRTAATGPLALVAGWARPTLIAASIVAVLAAGALLSTDRDPSSETAPAMAVDALGVPVPASQWLEAGREPDAGDLVLAMERRP
jgi:hypothetical protein